MARGKAQFTPGQYAKGQVLQVLPNQHAVFLIDGMKVLAKVEMDMVVGDRVWLQVKSAGQPTEFKLLTKSTKDGIQDLTRALGIQVGAGEKELMAKLIEEKIPITPKTWESTASVFKELGGSANDLELLLLAMKKGYPVSKEVLLGLKTFLQGNGFLSMVDSLRQELQSNNISPQDLTPAKNLELLLSKLTATLHPQQVNRDRILQGLISIHTLDSLQQELIQWRSSIQDQPALASMREKAEQLLQFITGQQWMMQSTENMIQQMVLHIPLKPFGERAFVQLEGKQKEKGELDPENCRLLFYLDLTHLGDMIMDIRIVNRVVSMDVYGNHPEGNHFQEYKTELQEDLKRLGYHLSVLKVNRKDHGENAALQAQPVIGSSYKGVDYRI